MKDLWGEPLRPSRPQPRKIVIAPLADVAFDSQDCLIYGHAFLPWGMNGEKICRLCHSKAYCPGCTPIKPSKTAIPLFCTKHTQGGRQA